MSAPLSSLGILEDSGFAWGNNLLDWLGVSGSLDSIRLGNDSGMDLLVKFLAGLDLSGGEALVPLGEEGLVLGWVFLLDSVHVSLDMDTKDSILVDLSVKAGLGLFGISVLTSLVGNLLN